MAQTFYPVIKGQTTPVSFARIWALHKDGRDIKIGLMPNGAYAQAPNGFPITDKADFEAIPEGRDRDQALAWYDRRGDRTVQEIALRKLYYEPIDDSWRYVDTRLPVDKQEDLIAALRGEALKAGMAWFHARHPIQPLTEEVEFKLLDQQIIELLHRDPNQTTEGLAKHFEVQPRQMLDLTKSMEAQGRIVRHGRGWYLPEHRDLSPQAPE
jgi:hypothetical protein